MWHLRLGHPASTVLHRLLSTFQLPLHGSSKFTSVCTECQMGKSKKLPFLASVSLSSTPLELVHCDLWGSSLEQSISGFNYYICFIDNCTKYIWLHPLSAKSHAFATFVKFKSYVENMLSLKIKSFQSDGGGEFTSNQFKEFLEINGINHRISYPHTLEQNGAADRTKTPTYSRNETYSLGPSSYAIMLLGKSF